MKSSLDAETYNDLKMLKVISLHIRTKKIIYVVASIYIRHLQLIVYNIMLV